MNATLTPIEVRILGCLIEKEATTPDVYPLTLNSLLTACNQKSSRDPVMELTSEEVTAALDSLIEQTLVSTWKSAHNRMAKFKHKLHDRISDKFNFSPPELAVLGVLFLRGPQTIGEIRTRSSRIHEFDNLDQVAEVLKALEDNHDGPYVTMLARREGRKESRYAHLFCGTAEESPMSDTRSTRALSGSNSRLELLEREVGELKATVQALAQRLERFIKQFE